VSYIVIQRGATNLPNYSEFKDLERAAAYLEGVCNEEGSVEVKLYRLEPIEFEVKRMFKVEIPSEESASSLATPEFGALDPSLAELDRQLTSEPRRGLFGR